MLRRPPSPQQGELTKQLPGGQSRHVPETFQPGRDVEADLALQAQRLQRDRIVGIADQHIAAEADTDRGAALGAGIGACEVALPDPRHRRIDTPRQRRLLGNSEIDSDLANGGDIAIFRHAFRTQHAPEIGY